MIRAVKNSPIAAAATMAMVMESSIVMRRSRMFSKASLRMGQPPTTRPTTPITLTAENGSQDLNQTAPAASATNAMRVASGQSKPWL